MIFLAIAAGTLIGISLGGLGGGGSILTVPVLVYLLGQSPHQATTASLIVVGFAALIGAVAHYRAGRVRLAAGIAFGAAGIGGSYAGSRLSAAVPANVLLAGFGLLMLVVAALMFGRRRSLADCADGQDAARTQPGAAALAAPAGPATPACLAGQADLTARADRTAGAELRTATASAAAAYGGAPGGTVAMLSRPAEPVVTGPRPTSTAARPRVRELALILAAATGVGLVTGFFGVGGGFVVVPALVLVLGFAMPAAAGTSLVVIAVNSVVALAARAAHGGPHLDWPLIAWFTAATAVGTLAGTSLAGRLNPRRLSAAFTMLVVLVGGYTLVRGLHSL